MFITIYNRLKEMQNRDAFHNDIVIVEESTVVLGVEDKKGLGEICKESRPPSNIFTTLLIDGRLEGSGLNFYCLFIFEFMCNFRNFKRDDFIFLILGVLRVC